MVVSSPHCCRSFHLTEIREVSVFRIVDLWIRFASHVTSSARVFLFFSFLWYRLAGRLIVQRLLEIGLSCYQK